MRSSQPDNASSNRRHTLTARCSCVVALTCRAKPQRRSRLSSSVRLGLYPPVSLQALCVLFCRLLWLRGARHRLCVHKCRVSVSPLIVRSFRAKHTSSSEQYRCFQFGDETAFGIGTYQGICADVWNKPVLAANIHISACGNRRKCVSLEIGKNDHFSVKQGAPAT